MRSLAEQYAEEYLSKVFYFCLKKTSDPQEAEELSSEISVHILHQLEKGVAPQHFSAWVWKIARNRYSGWAVKKRKNAAAGGGVALSPPVDVESTLIRGEELALLRRELAFTTADYRNLLIAYYLDDLSVREIAARTGLTAGNVKTRLFRARTLLKEGMAMAREFGARSYKPEEVHFAASGNQPSGLPWKAVERKIPKNILLETSGNPSTLEELSMALGIALPYMEEEVRLLCDATLLRKNGDKYITNFMILSRECQLDIYHLQRKDGKKRSALADRIAQDSLDAIRKLDIAGAQIGDDDLKWWVILHLLDHGVTRLTTEGIYNPKQRENGETWGFIGYETGWEAPEPIRMGHNGNGGSATFWAYKIGNYGLWDRAGEMDYSSVQLLAELISDHRTVDTLSELEQEIWKKIDGRFAHADQAGHIVPDILVLKPDATGQVDHILEQHPLFPELIRLIQNAYDGTAEILKRNSPREIHSELSYCTAMEILSLRMMTVNDEVEAGKLKVPAKPEKSTLAMYLEL